MERISTPAASNGDAEALVPVSTQCVHTACYCEENVWKLCEHIKDRNCRHIDHCWAVFISNHNKTIPLWRQKTSKAPEGVVIWDYHVILVAKHSFNGRYFVYDLDSTLSFPCDMNLYLCDAIRREAALKPEYRRLFRVVPAQHYLAHFASDRSHMLKEDKKTYIAEPPAYPAIRSAHSSNNIHEYICMHDTGAHMHDTGAHGTVMNLQQFTHKYTNS